MLVCVKLLKLLKSSFHLLNCWGQPPHKEDIKKTWRSIFYLAFNKSKLCIAQLWLMTLDKWLTWDGKKLNKDDHNVDLVHHCPRVVSHQQVNHLSVLICVSLVFRGKDCTGPVTRELLIWLTLARRGTGATAGSGGLNLGWRGRSSPEPEPCSVFRLQILMTLPDMWTRGYIHCSFK